MGDTMDMNTRLHTDTADIRASLRAAYLKARETGDHQEMTRLNALAVEVDSLRAKLALGALDQVARKVTAIRLGDLAGQDVPENRSHTQERIAAHSDDEEVEPVVETPGASQPDKMPIAWGAVTQRKHGPEFNNRVRQISDGLGCDPSHLMAVMAFETGESFDPAQRNAAGSGATGLIQFMPRTARALGTTTAKLAGMTAIRQLDFVESYFASTGRGRLSGLSDLYMAVLWPAAVGRPEAYVLFRKPSRAYQQNRGLDVNRDGVITKAEATAKVAAKLAKGMRKGRIG